TLMPQLYMEATKDQPKFHNRIPVVKTAPRRVPLKCKVENTPLPTALPTLSRRVRPLEFFGLPDIGLAPQYLHSQCRRFESQAVDSSYCAIRQSPIHQPCELFGFRGPMNFPSPTS